ncbi:MAG: bifunctional UDP-N-acetylglucosamine diphosphorylase/glucosamine-1-phosphate N-acetyltransferase GlmU [Thiobacillus sp.]|uniref:bifunctional UDP-N-acetylglucosamine diphosphorylase/glucosamine-1-phosphate N-acetyltransferase GlmU n=1 Tax=Thiobacillus sp. TaxID=924 RepID=UPI0028956403|nr:bifunctional UDP-N-acetylglucosamine diphosphorylase/glucosamine-1-phosphate N-acetyltransferase GlmU [Thiobacillus sp.]MDT3706051.1 bifunctional UDP-N-acetylglucosamine diphosphorylase/glucosamine-1-phosphate N-acetyltransferase GlmU [Thiobacillus sp.]
MTTAPSKLEILILAAGKGTRMRSDLPKVLHRLAGKPLLGHVVDTAHALGAVQTCVVYGFGGEAVPQAMADARLTFVLQAEQHGTGHAVKQALPRLADDSVTLVLYGDVPLTRTATLQPLVAAAQTGKLGLLTVNLAHPDGYGRIVRENGRVVRIVEHKDAVPAERAIQEVNTGILAVTTRHLKRWISELKNDNVQGEYYLTDVIALAVRDGVAVETHQPAHEWEVLGVNSKAQLAELERIHQNEIAQGLLDAGVTLLDPARLDVRGMLACGRDVTIDVNCVFEGRVELGDGVQVGANCVLRNVTVAAGTRIDAFTLIDDAAIGEANRLGPFSRIRPGTRLARDVHVGNFVEIKNSQIDDGSKVNHLSYVGDTTMGKHVNIGAGTITCNYDGANKYRTVIEDEVFVGSDTQLVAPVTVGRGATLGAGTTLTRDAPAGELTLSRARQLTINGWKRPLKQKKEG